MAWIYAMLPTAETLFLGLGAVVYLLSIGLYLGRTRDLRGVVFFWSVKMRLNPTEFWLNRVGIILLLLGVIARFFNVMLLLG